MACAPRDDVPYGPAPAAVNARSFRGCAAGTTVRSACVGVVEDLYERWDLPSVYLLIDGRLRCQAARGYVQISDGFPPTTGVIGRVVSSGAREVLQDVTTDPSFVAAVPGLRAEVCVPVRVFGAVVGAVNLESRAQLGPDVVADVERAADVLGQRLEALGGLPVPSPAERLARIAVDMAGQTGLLQIRQHALRGAQEISGMSSAALAYSGPDGWVVTYAVGPLADVVQSWDARVLQLLADRVRDRTSSYFEPGDDAPAGYEFLSQEVRALSVQPLIVAGEVVGLLVTAHGEPTAHDPTLTTAMELLATQTAAMIAMRRTLEALAREATRDPLTGLRNRRRLLSRLDTAAGIEGTALLLLDLDGFKAVNDRFGHARGDDLLRDVAQRLTRAAREGDLIFRLGGDEFAVLAHEVASPAAAAVLGARFVAAVNRDGGDGEEPRIGASAGVRLLTGQPASSALVDADVALYAAKHSGRGRTVVWQPSLQRDEQEQEALLSDLRHALRHGSLSLRYQPVVDLRTLRVRGLEALARWHSPTRGEVPPSVFVACAERAGIARELSRWALRTAFAVAASWPPCPDGHLLKVGVNLSAAQLADDHVVQDVRAELARSGLSPGRAVLEVTETAPLADLARARATLQALAELGCHLALDDFGTGYSSLTHAHALPFHILKIDRSFVAGAAAQEPGAVATIAAVCALATRLGVDVVAEGIESAGLSAELTGLGCHYAQGDALAPPLTAEQVGLTLAEHARDGWTVRGSAGRTEQGT